MTSGPVTLAAYELTTDMEEKVTVNSPIDCIAVYYDGGLLRQYSNRVSNAEQIALWDYLRENETFFTRYMSSSRENWRLAKIEEDYYLLSIYRTSGCTILTLLRVDTIFGGPPLLRGQPGAVRPGLCRRGSGVPFARRGRQRAFPLYPNQARGNMRLTT